MKNFEDYFEGIFDFTKGQRLGLISLFFLIVLAANIHRFFGQKNPKEIYKLLPQPIGEYEDFGKTKEKSLFNLEKTPLNPNHATLEQLISVGMNPKTAKILINFRNKGARFKNLNDLDRIYGMDKKWLQTAGNLFVFDEKQDKNTLMAAEHEVFGFDPNTVNPEAMKKLGFDEKTIKTIENFRSKGGHFYKKEDLLKIYGLKAEFYQELEPFIEIVQPKIESNSIKSNSEQMQVSAPKAKEKPKLKVNAAVIEDWVELPGIGPATATKIINYRNKLGGFYSIEQIAKTPKLPDSVFRKLVPLVTLDPFVPPIKINQVTIETLLKHPEFDMQTATKIINYRNKNGQIKDMNDINQMGLTPERLVIIKEYIQFK